MADPTAAEVRQGVRRLRALLPLARAKVTPDGHFINPSVLLTAQAPYVRADNFHALLITPGEKGGWEIDLWLVSVPRGVPNVLGSPVAEPYRTVAAAEAAALDMLVLALTLERDFNTQNIKAGPPTFVIHDLAISLSPLVLDRMGKQNPNGPPATVTPAWLHDRIGSFVAEHFPDGMTADAVRALPKPVAIELMARLHQAAFAGVLVHPPPEAKPPAPHNPSPRTEH